MKACTMSKQQDYLKSIKRGDVYSQRDCHIPAEMSRWETTVEYILCSESVFTGKGTQLQSLPPTEEKVQN